MTHTKLSVVSCDNTVRFRAHMCCVKDARHHRQNLQSNVWSVCEFIHSCIHFPELPSALRSSKSLEHLPRVSIPVLASSSLVL